MLYQGYAEQRREYLQKHKRVSEYDSENLMHSVIQEILSDEPFSSIGCAVHFSLATLVKDYAPLTEEERKYARNPLTHVDFLLFNQMDKQPVLAIEVDGGSHKSGSKQAERDAKKNSILDKCAIPLLRLRTDGNGEKENMLIGLTQQGTRFRCLSQLILAVPAIESGGKADPYKPHFVGCCLKSISIKEKIKNALKRE